MGRRLTIAWVLLLAFCPLTAFAQPGRPAPSVLDAPPAAQAPPALPVTPLAPITPPPAPPIEIAWSALRLLPDEPGEALALPQELGVPVSFERARCYIEPVERIARQEGEHQVTELTSAVRCDGDASVRIAGTRFGDSRTGCAYNQDASLVTGGRATFFVSDAQGQALGAIELHCKARRPGIPVEVIPANAAELR